MKKTILTAIACLTFSAAIYAEPFEQVPEELILNYHLMHPGGKSIPGDPNVAFYLDGIYHLHYILGHLWDDKHSFSFVHVTSPDMLNWTWQTTKLQPAFTGKEAKGLTIEILSATGMIRLGTTQAPFAVADLPEGEDLELRIFIDKYLVEVFANDRQALLTAHMDYEAGKGLDAYSWEVPTQIKTGDLETQTHERGPPESAQVRHLGTQSHEIIP